MSLVALLPPKVKEYLWAELGALLGAVLAVPSAVGVNYLVLLAFQGFITGYDLDPFLSIGLTTGVVVLILGSSFGCWFALRRAGYPAARKAARLLFLLLLVTYLAAVASTGPGFDFELVDAPAKLLPPATFVPLVMPLVATWITRLVPKSVKIQTLVLLLLGLGAYGIFSSPRAIIFPVEPEASPTVEAFPTVEEEVPAGSQLPLGSENPCWLQTYPDDPTFLESDLHRSASDLLVDPQTKDIYDSVCINDRLTQGANWPPGVAERLVRASDL
jgi:hypothetical protein